jgi:hypothetical protein
MLKNETKFPRRRKGGELESKTLRRFAPKAAKRLFSGFPSFGVGPWKEVTRKEATPPLSVERRDKERRDVERSDEERSYASSFRLFFPSLLF